MENHNPQEEPLISTLILGFGNADRQDDGVAWHILNRLAVRLERPISDSPDEGFQLSGNSPELLFTLQLIPEMAEMIGQFDRVCFVDAHTGSVPQDVKITPVREEFQSSPFTHHMTPATLLALAGTLYGKHPEALLVSVRGYAFEFDRSLSERTDELASQAVEAIWNWLSSKETG